MKRLRRSLLIAAVAALTGRSAVLAAELSPAAHREITQLLEMVGSSGCRFHRNGTWYTGAEARKHLERKRDWMLERGALSSAEQFISDAASQSSVSGEPYLMQCGQSEPKRCGDWLQAELRRMRQAAR